MSYAEDTKFASESLLNLALREEKELEHLKVQLSDARARFHVNKWDFDSSDLNDDFSDAYVMAAFSRMAQAHSEIGQLEVETSRIEAAIGSKQVAIQALCGALLQIAKQGISYVHGSLENSPDGRLIKSIPLKEIIWQGRNQAMHFEEATYRGPVTNLFGQLEQEFGSEFSLTTNVRQSLAKQIVSLLSWQDHSIFHSDMDSLGLANKDEA